MYVFNVFPRIMKRNARVCVNYDSETSQEQKAGSSVTLLASHKLCREKLDG